MVAAWLIAQRSVNTLVLVHRRQTARPMGRASRGFPGRAGKVDRSNRRRPQHTDRAARCGRHSEPRSQRCGGRPRRRLRPGDRRRMSPPVGAQLRAGRPPREGADRPGPVATVRRGRTDIIRSSSCSAVPCGIGWTPGHRRRRGRSNTGHRASDFVSLSHGHWQADKRVEFQALYQFLVDDETRNGTICEEIAQAVGRAARPWC